MKIVTLSRLRGFGRPTTVVRITKSGRARFLAYIDELEAVIRAVHEGQASEATQGFGRLATSS
jgi:predicted ArsR family transcriptional regulator